MEPINFERRVLKAIKSFEYLGNHTLNIWVILVSLIILKNVWYPSVKNPYGTDDMAYEMQQVLWIDSCKLLR